ncbi:hypothetical protein NQZ68_032274 [Dissostichus eleginoides]|nr:hypothetical protein NQZ68_032274 [Dissostichus eleginoides]
MSLHRCCKYIITAPLLYTCGQPLKLLLGDISPPKNPPGGQLTCTGHRTDALTGETSPRRCGCCSQPNLTIVEAQLFTFFHWLQLGAAGSMHISIGPAAVKQANPERVCPGFV